MEFLSSIIPGMSIFESPSLNFIGISSQLDILYFINFSCGCESVLPLVG